MVAAVVNPWHYAAERLYPTPNPFLQDPVGWITHNTGEVLWSKQRRVCELVRDNRYVAVKSCHDTGKSFISSRIFLWWMDVHAMGEAFGVTTAPTTPQVEAILWREIGRGHNILISRNEVGEIQLTSLPGRITLDAKLYMGPGGKELVAYGRKPADYDPSGFVGIHSRFPLIIVDEAGGVPKALFDAVDSLATNFNARVLAIGNPDDPSSHFATICKPGSGWVVETISAFDTPAFTGEEVPEELLELLISREWVEERKKRWGVESPVYVSKVLGQFPDISDDTLIHPKWVKRAQLREIEPNKEPVLGVDIARYGTDETVIVRREGGWARVIKTTRKQSTMQTAGLIRATLEEISAQPINQWPYALLDANGVGAGVFDRLAEDDIPVVGLETGGGATDTKRFANARAEWYWMLREAFERDEIDIDPDDDDLASQLQSIKFKYTSKGQVLIESKEDMRKRKMPSPDRADALCYAWVQGQTPVIDVESHKGTTVTGDLMEAGW